MLVLRLASVPYDKDRRPTLSLALTSLVFPSNQLTLYSK